MQLGIGEVEKVVKVVTTLKNVAGEAAADGRIDLKDVPRALPELYAVLMDLQSIDLALALKQAADVDPSEAQALADLYAKELKLPQTGVEALLEEGAKIVAETVGVVETLKELTVKVLALVKKAQDVLSPVVAQ